jgi:hypothetical protein
MDQVKIKCIDNGRELTGDVVSKTRTAMVVAIHNNTKLTFYFNPEKKIWLSSMAGLEFMIAKP